MPKMVGRFYLAPTFSFAPGAYDTDGKYQKYDNGSVKLFNLGLALEFGITDWITGAVQWTPGWTPWSDAKAAAPSAMASQIKGDINANGVADLFAGAKIQIVGTKAPVKNDMFRFSVAPGVIIPMPGPNFQDQMDNIVAEKTATLASNDKHVFAAGGRFYFDYIINKNFFLNLYNETIFYPVKQDLDKDGPNLAAAKLLIPMAAGAAGPVVSADLKDATGEVSYKYKLTFELEPQYSTPFGNGMIFSAGLPVHYVYSPAYDYSVSNVGTGLTAYGGDSEKLLLDALQGDPQQSLSLVPNVSVMLTKTPLPLEFKLQYSVPVYGKNVMARNNITLQVKAYFALPGADLGK
ncbi:MAG: hypothetical protein FWC45_05390 [Treponema sp.]|nr:hypothetical protein [Treponema sp.]